MALDLLEGTGEAGADVRAKINNGLLRVGSVALIGTISDIDNLSYSTSSAWAVAADDRVYAIDGGHRWKVLLLGEANYDLANANGVLLDAVKGDNGEYNFGSLRPAANGVTDDYAKFARLIARGDTDGTPPRIYVPPGQYYMSQTINIKSPLTIRGDHTGFGLDTVCQFIFPAATTGMVINRFNTLGWATVGSGGLADGASIMGIRLTGGRGSAFNIEQSGLFMRARCYLFNVSVDNFAGHGVYNGAGSDGNPYLGNTNLAYVNHVLVEANRGNGFHNEGTDANAGIYIAINAKNNDGWGVYEDSFLNNIHIGHHALDNDAGAYFSSNQSLLLGCYAEDGNGDNVQWAGTMDGCMITDFSASLGPKLQTEQANGPRALRNDTGGFRGTNATCSADLGSESGNIVTSRHTTTGISYPFRLRWKASGVGVEIGYGSFSTALLNFNSNTTTETYGRSSAVGESVQMNGFFLGVGSGARYRGTGTAAPTTGTWARGDIIENINISSGSPMCWGCSVAGTPGTWIAGPNWP